MNPDSAQPTWSQCWFLFSRNCAKTVTQKKLNCEQLLLWYVAWHSEALALMAKVPLCSRFDYDDSLINTYQFNDGCILEFLLSRFTLRMPAFLFIGLVSPFLGYCI